MIFNFKLRIKYFKTIAVNEIRLGKVSSEHQCDVVLLKLYCMRHRTCLLDLVNLTIFFQLSRCMGGVVGENTFHMDTNV